MISTSDNRRIHFIRCLERTSFDIMYFTGSTCPTFNEQYDLACDALASVLIDQRKTNLLNMTKRVMYYFFSFFIFLCKL